MILSIQNFDKEWDDWTDVRDISEVPKRTVLRCVYSLPENPVKISSPANSTA